MYLQNYNYKTKFKLTNNLANFTETFTNVLDNSVIKNEHTLFMPSKEVILRMAKSRGFILKNEIELREVGYENHYICILKSGS